MVQRVRGQLFHVRELAAPPPSLPGAQDRGHPFFIEANLDTDLRLTLEVTVVWDRGRLWNGAFKFPDARANM